jgi:hypothetical protein
MATAAVTVGADVSEQSGPAYMRGRRDLRIDLLRGAAIFAMVVDHVSGDKSWLYAITGGDRFYVSAAEAFVFLSGIVAGTVYGPLAARRGGIAAARLIKRSGIIYALTVGLTLIAPFAAKAMGLGWEDPLHDRTVPQFVVSVLSVHLTYHLMDVLLLYVLLFALAAALIVWMDDGHTRAVLIGSWFFWVVWQTAADSPAPWDIQAMNVFQFAAWQALFMTALAIGMHRHRFPTPSRGVWIGCLVAGAIGFGACIASYQLRVVNKVWGASFASHFLSKADLGTGRLIVFAFLGLFAFSLATLAWPYVNAALGWLLIPMGQRSLAAYVLHIPVVMAVSKLTLMIFPQGTSETQTVLLQLLGVLLVWVMVLPRRQALALPFLRGNPCLAADLARVSSA